MQLFFSAVELVRPIKAGKSRSVGNFLVLKANGLPARAPPPPLRLGPDCSMSSTPEASGINGQAPLWAHLSIDLLRLVAAKLIRMSDYIRFRSVCTSWRRAASPAGLRPQPPLLMLPYHPFSDGVRSFFCLSTGKVHDVAFPQSHGRIVLNSAGGWLAMLDLVSSSLLLLNPVTAAQIDLPSTAGFCRLPRALVAPDLQSYEVVDYKGNRDTLGFNMSFIVCPWEVFLSPNPGEGGFVFVSILYSRDLVYCKPGDEAWTVVRNVFAARAWTMAHHEGRLYVVDGEKRFYVVEMAEAPAMVILAVGSIPIPRAPRFSLANARGGEVVIVGAREEGYEDDGELFEIFRLEFDRRDGEPSLEWRKVEAGGGQAVFWAERQSWVVDVAGFSGCRGGCAYLCNVRDSKRGGSDGEECGVRRCIDVADMTKPGGGLATLSFGWEQKNTTADLMRPFWVTVSLG